MRARAPGGRGARLRLHSGDLGWTGGNARLVFVGDLIDKGPRSLDTIDLVRVLAALAPAAGGRVIACMGNHEAELLADPNNSKADALRVELPAVGVTQQQLISP